jgi:hypothetical protein
MPNRQLTKEVAKLEQALKVFSTIKVVIGTISPHNSHMHDTLIKQRPQDPVSFFITYML